MYDFNRGYEDENYISDTNAKEQRIRQLCEYYNLKRKPKGRKKITNYYMYYGIPKPPVNRGNNLSKYYLETGFIEPNPIFYEYAEDYYEHQRTFDGIRIKYERYRKKSTESILAQSKSCNGKSANYF